MHFGTHTISHWLGAGISICYLGRIAVEKYEEDEEVLNEYEDTDLFDEDNEGLVVPRRVLNGRIPRILH